MIILGAYYYLVNYFTDWISKEPENSFLRVLEINAKIDIEKVSFLTGAYDH